MGRFLRDIACSTNLGEAGGEAFDHLKRACEGGTRPYGVTVKTFLGHYGRESRRRRGRTSARKVTARWDAVVQLPARLVRPVPSSAVFLWQGVLQGPRDLARVQVPVPLDWLQDAGGTAFTVGGVVGLASQRGGRRRLGMPPPFCTAKISTWWCAPCTVQERRIEATQPLKEFTI